jgi:hypothetical protein
MTAASRVGRRMTHVKRKEAMDEDRFNMELRKFLKIVGVTSQREIEKALRAALAAGTLRGVGSVRAKAVVTVPAIGLNHTVEEEVALE